MVEGFQAAQKTTEVSTSQDNVIFSLSWSERESYSLRSCEGELSWFLVMYASIVQNNGLLLGLKIN